MIQVGEITSIGLVDAAEGASNQMIDNALDGKPLTEGVGTAAVTNAVAGRIGDGVAKVVGDVVNTKDLEKVAKITGDRNARVNSISSNEAANKAASALGSAQTVNEATSTTVSETTQGTTNAVVNTATQVHTTTTATPTSQPVDNTNYVKPIY